MRAALARPSSWIALAVLLLAVDPAEGPASAGVAPSDLAVVVAALLAIRSVLAGRHPAIVRSVPAAGFLAFAVATSLATLAAGNFPENVVGGARFLQLFLFAPIAVMVALRCRKDAFVVLGSVVALALLEGVLGLVQYVTGTGAGIGAESVRAVGTFGAYNIGTLAHLTALGFVICLAVAVVRHGLVRRWAAGAAVVLLLANLAALSRGAWVALAVTGVVVLSRGRPARLLATAATAALLAVAVLPAVVASGSAVGRRLESLFASGSDPDQSLVDRAALWRAARDMALDHPLTGVGPRAFPEHRDAYADFSLLGSSDISFATSFQQVALESPHSLYLLIAAEQGLVALFVFATLLAVLLARALVRAARHRSDVSTTVALVGAGLLCYEAIVMVTGDLGGPGSILTGIAVGVAGWAAADIDLPPAPPGGDPRAPSARKSASSPPEGARAPRDAAIARP